MNVGAAASELNTFYGDGAGAHTAAAAGSAAQTVGERSEANASQPSCLYVTRMKTETRLAFGAESATV